MGGTRSSVFRKMESALGSEQFQSIGISDQNMRKDASQEYNDENVSNNQNNDFTRVPRPLTHSVDEMSPIKARQKSKMKTHRADGVVRR